MQALIRIPEIQQLLNQGLRFLHTGRDAKEIDVFDNTADLSKLSKFYTCFKDISQQMQKQDSQLSSELTRDLLWASGALNPRWKDTYNDVDGYYEFVLKVFALLVDRSDPNTIEKGETAIQQWQKAIEKRTDSRNVFKDAREYIRAYTASGHDSALARSHLLHSVQEWQCSLCDAIQRQSLSDWLLTLKAPISGQSFTMEEARVSSIDKILAGPGICSCEESQAFYKSDKDPR